MASEIVELLPDHYRLCATYAPMPSLSNLKKEFGEDNVSVMFDGRPFTLHASCADMDRTPGDRIVYCCKVGYNWRREEQIAWGLKQRSAIAPNGYRTATAEEAYEFYRAQPKLRNYVALGSSALLDSRRSCAVLWSGNGSAVFAGRRVDYEFGARTRILFVSK